MNTFAKKLSRIALLVLATSCVLSSANAINVKPEGRDYQITRISGNSMLPTLKGGETAVVYKAYPFKKLRIGDVVIIESEKGYSVIHRIVRRHRGGTWITQGDNNRHEDREVLKSSNFGGLALVDESMVRYQNYLASITPDTEVEETTRVARADTTETSRFDRLRKL